LEEQRLYEMTKLQRQFQDLLTKSGLLKKRGARQWAEGTSERIPLKGIRAMVCLYTFFCSLDRFRGRSNCLPAISPSRFLDECSLLQLSPTCKSKSVPIPGRLLEFISKYWPSTGNRARCWSASSLFQYRADCSNSFLNTGQVQAIALGVGQRQVTFQERPPTNTRIFAPEVKVTSIEHRRPTNFLQSAANLVQKDRPLIGEGHHPFRSHA
jgi:hypothetical protein